MVEDDMLWDQVIGRIRELDDPRLTTGVARRLAARFRSFWSRSASDSPSFQLDGAMPTERANIWPAPAGLIRVVSRPFLTARRPV